MALDPVSSTVAATQSSGIASVQDFLKILLAQITYQDPLKPLDNQQFLSQMAQFTALEQTQQINDKIDALLSTQSSLQSVGLLGRTVDLNAEAGGGSGSVSSISLANGVPILTVTPAAGTPITGILLSQILTVR
jgi:flagellar basal-body rod modification protein FlgD